MKLTTRGQYATRALLDLAEHYQKGPVAIEGIAARQGVPRKYLERLLLDLKAAGFVQSVRGRQGGYRLARPPQEITVGAVVRAMEGPLAPIACASEDVAALCGCPRVSTCGLRTVWAEVRDAMAAVLDRTTLAEVLRRSEELRQQKAGAAMYFI